MSLAPADVAFLDSERERAELKQRFISLEFTRRLHGVRGEFDGQNPEHVAALNRYLAAAHSMKSRFDEKTPRLQTT